MSQAMTTQREQSPREIVRIQLDKMDAEIEAVLPEHVTVKKFKRIALTAISRNADLLEADRATLFAACLDCAQDGLVPDGREAALVVFKAKVGGRWIKKVQYMPMIYGVYKKVRNTGEISTLSAHVVYANDAFEYWVDEDGPHLRHAPLLLGERGTEILLYAVCKLKDGSVEIETMLKGEIEDVRQISKSAGGPAWSNWWGEMARKTVVRRLSKRLPMSSDQERLMHRDDSMYDLDQEKRPAVDAPARPDRIDYQPNPPAQGEDFDEQFRRHTADHAGNETESASGETEEEHSEGEAAAEQGREPVNQASVTPAPERKAADSAGQPFLADDGRAILYDGAGKKLNSYERAGNFFKAVLAQIPKEADPRAFLEANEAAANHFVSKDGGLMGFWDECSKAAADAEAAGAPA